ncbi:MAG: hypothetical protein ACI8YQ_001591 [Polaribacter sp.]|jgi:hypothetical protein
MTTKEKPPPDFVEKRPSQKPIVKDFFNILNC